MRIKDDDWTRQIGVDIKSMKENHLIMSLHLSLFLSLSLFIVVAVCLFTPVHSAIYLASYLSAALINGGCVAMVARQS